MVLQPTAAAAEVACLNATISNCMTTVVMQTPSKLLVSYGTQEQYAHVDVVSSLHANINVVCSLHAALFTRISFVCSASCNSCCSCLLLARLLWSWMDPLNTQAASKQCCGRLTKGALGFVTRLSSKLPNQCLSRSFPHSFAHPIKHLGKGDPVQADDGAEAGKDVA